MKNLETVRTEVRENSLIIYLSREERMNAFTLTMQQEIVEFALIKLASALFSQKEVLSLKQHRVGFFQD